MAQEKTIVIIPTFNEAENLRRLLPQLLEHPLSILVIDDSSSDGGAQVVRSFTSEGGTIDLLERPTKMGLGSAYREGFARAIANKFAIIVQMDADGSHRVPDLLQMLQFLYSQKDIELVIGSRWVKGGSVQNWPKYREALSRLANSYARIALGFTIKDSTAGFRIYRTQLLQRMNLSKITSNGYAFQIEMTREAARVNAKIQEVPITFIEREIGASKMSAQIILEALVKVTTWGFSRAFKRG